MAQDIEGLLQGLKARHRAELGVVKGLVDTLVYPGSEVEALHKVAADSVGRLFEMFVSKGVCGEFLIHCHFEMSGGT